MNMLRPHRADDNDMRELVLGTLVDLQQAATAMTKQGDAIAELAAGNSPDAVLHSETRLISKTTGMLTIDSRVPAASIAVVNLGTAVMTIANSGPAAVPPGPSAGSIRVLPGQAICVPLRGSLHTIWGRPGDLVTFISWKTLQPFSISSAGATYFAAQLGTLTFGGTASFTYTTPNGDNAYYGGLAVSDLAGPAGTSDVTELTIKDSAGVELDTIHLAGAESTEDSHTNPTVATTNKIVVTCTKGSVEGLIRVW